MLLMTVDSNELATNPKVVELLKGVYPDLEVSHLPFGDINIVLDNGSLLSIERKNAADFLGSISDGHIFNQVERMSAGAKFYAIIVLGDMSFSREDMTIVEGRETGWKGASVRAAIMAINWSGCPIIWTSFEGLPYAINEVVKFCEKPEVHSVLSHKRIVTFPPIDERVRILTTFNGVGPKLADSLLRFAKDQFKEEAEKRKDLVEDPYGTVSEALMWISAFPLIAEKSRPAGWGNKIVHTIRLQLGLDKYQYLEIKEDKKR